MVMPSYSFIPYTYNDTRSCSKHTQSTKAATSLPCGDVIINHINILKQGFSTVISNNQRDGIVKNNPQEHIARMAHGAPAIICASRLLHK